MTPDQARAIVISIVAIILSIWIARAVYLEIEHRLIIHRHRQAMKRWSSNRSPHTHPGETQDQTIVRLLKEARTK